MAKLKTTEKGTDSGHDLIRKMPPRSRTGATAWLLRESGAEPMLFEMAQALGLVEFRPVAGHWVGSLFGIDETPQAEETTKGTWTPPDNETPLPPPKKKKPAKPSNQLDLF